MNTSLKSLYSLGREVFSMVVGLSMEVVGMVVAWKAQGGPRMVGGRRYEEEGEFLMSEISSSYRLIIYGSHL